MLIREKEERLSVVKNTLHESQLDTGKRNIWLSGFAAVELQPIGEKVYFVLYVPTHLRFTYKT